MSSRSLNWSGLGMTGKSIRVDRSPRRTYRARGPLRTPADDQSTIRTAWRHSWPARSRPNAPTRWSSASTTVPTATGSAWRRQRGIFAASARPGSTRRMVRLLLDCAEICRTSADFMIRGSELHPHICRGLRRRLRALRRRVRQDGRGPLHGGLLRDLPALRAESCAEMAAAAYAASATGRDQRVQAQPALRREPDPFAGGPPAPSPLRSSLRWPRAARSLGRQTLAGAEAQGRSPPAPPPRRSAAPIPRRRVARASDRALVGRPVPQVPAALSGRTRCGPRGRAR